MQLRQIHFLQLGKILTARRRLIQLIILLQLLTYMAAVAFVPRQVQLCLLQLCFTVIHLLAQSGNLFFNILLFIKQAAALLSKVILAAQNLLQLCQQLVALLLQLLLLHIAVGNFLLSALLLPAVGSNLLLQPQCILVQAVHSLADILRACGRGLQGNLGILQLVIQGGNRTAVFGNFLFQAIQKLLGLGILSLALRNCCAQLLHLITACHIGSGDITAVIQKQQQTLVVAHLLLLHLLQIELEPVCLQLLLTKLCSQLLQLLLLISFGCFQLLQLFLPAEHFGMQLLHLRCRLSNFYITAQIAFLMLFAAAAHTAAGIYHIAVQRNYAQTVATGLCRSQGSINVFGNQHSAQQKAYRIFSLRLEAD